MTLEELARRVFQAENRVMAAHGADIHDAEVVLNRDDWLDVLMANPDSPEKRHWVYVSPTDPDEVWFRGHHLRMDPRLKPGDVRLRTEVYA